MSAIWTWKEKNGYKLPISTSTVHRFNGEATRNLVEVREDDVRHRCEGSCGFGKWMVFIKFVLIL